jgi:hypothetical protein
MSNFRDTPLAPDFSTCLTHAAGGACRRGALVLLVIAALAGCSGEPDGPGFAPSPGIVGAPPPELAVTERFREELAASGPRAERLVAGGEALGARAAGLDARAGRLSGPVVDPDRRARMLAAAARGAPPQP